MIFHRNSWVVSLFAIVVVPTAAGAALPDESLGSSSGAGVSTGAIRVEVAAGIDDAHLFQGWIEERNPGVAEALPPFSGQQWVAVGIAGATYDYEVSIGIMRDGEPGPVADSFVCECNSATLLLRIDQGITGVVRQVQPNPEPKVEPKPEPSDETSDVPRRFGALGAGIGVGVLGLGMIGAGIPLALRPDETLQEATGTHLYSTRPAGVALAVAGGVALAGGVTLVVIDSMRRRKTRIAALPTVGPGLGGVSLGGRF